MDINGSWSRLMHAEDLHKQGYNYLARRQLSLVLDEMPGLLEQAVSDNLLKQCQLSCLMTGLTDAAHLHADILEGYGHYDLAFESLDQINRQYQFWALDPAFQSIEASLKDATSRLFQRQIQICQDHRSTEWQARLGECYAMQQSLARLQQLSVFTPHKLAS